MRIIFEPNKTNTKPVRVSTTASTRIKKLYGFFIITRFLTSTMHNEPLLRIESAPTNPKINLSSNAASPTVLPMCRCLKTLVLSLSIAEARSPSMSLDLQNGYKRLVGLSMAILSAVKIVFHIRSDCLFIKKLRYNFKLQEAIC